MRIRCLLQQRNDGRTMTFAWELSLAWWLLLFGCQLAVFVLGITIGRSIENWSLRNPPQDHQPGQPIEDKPPVKITVPKGVRT